MNNIIFKSIFIYIFLFLLKKIFQKIKILKNFFIKNLFFRHKKNSFKFFLKKNKDFWKINKKDIHNPKILISNFISTPGDIITNCVIAKYLEEKFKTSSIGILDRGEEILQLLESYDIKNNFCLYDKNLIFKVKIYWKTIVYFNRIKDVNQLYNFKLNKNF